MEGANICIGNKCFIGQYSALTVWTEESDKEYPEMIIGDGVSIGAFNHITCTNRIVIGDGVLTGKFVTVTDNSHGNTDYASLHIKPNDRDVVSKGPVVIGNNVWIGDKATILPGGNNWRWSCYRCKCCCDKGCTCLFCCCR